MMTKTFRTYAAFANHAQHQSGNVVEIRLDSPVVWFRCATCHATLKQTFPDDADVTAFARKFQLRAQDATWQ
jgi:hypothetical protein